MVSETGDIRLWKYITIYVYFTFRKPFFTCRNNGKLVKGRDTSIESEFYLANLALHLSLSLLLLLLFFCFFFDHTY